MGSNVGDFVTRLMVDASSYQQGINRAVSANKTLHGSVEGIIGQMEREQAALNRAGRSTAQNIMEAGVDPDRTRLALEMNRVRERRFQDQQVAGMHRSGQQRIDDRNVERQLSEQRLGGADGLVGLSRKSMIATEAMRGLEDAVAGFTNNGLKGMLQATTNNVGQIGALIGGTAGLTLGMSSIAAMAAVTVIPMFQKWMSGTDEVIKREKLLAQEAKKTTDAYLGEIERRANASFKKQDIGRNVRRLIEENPPAASNDIQREIEAARERGLGARRQGNVETITQVEIERQIRANNHELPFEQAAGNKDGVTALERGIRELEKQKRESLERQRIAKADAIHADQQLDALATARAKAQAREMANAKILEAEREREQLREMRRDRAVMTREPLPFNEDNFTRKEMAVERMGAGDWAMERRKDLAIGAANRKTLNGGEMLQAQADYQDRVRHIQRGVETGGIGVNEGYRLQMQEEKERDRRIREAKYGGQTADGSTGVNSADAKSVAGFNSMMKGGRYSEQQKQIDELKRNGDISAETTAAVRELIRIQGNNQPKLIEFH